MSVYPQKKLDNIIPESGFDHCFSLLIIGINRGTEVRVAYIRHVPHSNDRNHFRLSLLDQDGEPIPSSVGMSSDICSCIFSRRATPKTWPRCHGRFNLRASSSRASSTFHRYAPSASSSTAFVSQLCSFEAQPYVATSILASETSEVSLRDRKRRAIHPPTFLALILYPHLHFLHLQTTHA